MLNEELFRFNRSEFWLFRLVKPVGWTLFATTVICVIIFSILFVVNFLKIKGFDTFEFTDATAENVQLAKIYNQHIGKTIDAIYIYFMIFMISAYICVLTRLNTRLWSIFRTSNQYISETSPYFMDRKKLVITLIFFFLILVFNTLVFVSVWYVFGWFRPFVDNINNANNVTYQLLTKTNTIINANIIVDNFIQTLKDNLSQINIESLLKSCGIMLVMGIVAIILWIITNSIYGLIVLFYTPKYLDSTEKHWTYLDQVDEKTIKSKMLPVGKKMSYAQYHNWSTNGFGDKHQLMRDRQYDTYMKRRHSK